MAKSFKVLERKMSPEALARSEEKAKRLIAEMPLQELRAARKLTQEELAKTLNVNQAAVSKLERRADMYVSTLREFVRAMGGELEITARFPEGAVRINQFEDVDTVA
ncbi:MAG: helix-turn-helix domain-containing protein [Acidobacteriota bacterium]|nr:helix-turn-helix domain-containing protein [Acidobacteriota bacterium]